MTVYPSVWGNGSTITYTTAETQVVARRGGKAPALGTVAQKCERGSRLIARLDLDHLSEWKRTGIERHRRDRLLQVRLLPVPSVDRHVTDVTAQRVGAVRGRRIPGHGCP